MYDVKKEARKIETIAKSVMHEDTGDYAKEKDLIAEISAIPLDQVSAVLKQVNKDNETIFTTLPTISLDLDSNKHLSSVRIAQSNLDSAHYLTATFNVAGKECYGSKIPTWHGWKNTTMPSERFSTDPGHKPSRIYVNPY